MRQLVLFCRKTLQGLWQFSRLLREKSSSSCRTRLRTLTEEYSYSSVKGTFLNWTSQSSTTERLAQRELLLSRSIPLSYPERGVSSKYGPLWVRSVGSRYPRTVITSRLRSLSVCWVTTQSSLTSKWGQQKKSSKTWRKASDVIRFINLRLLQAVVTVG